MPFIERRGTRIHYEIFPGPEGAPWLAFIPGLAANTRAFPEMIARLQRRVHVLAIDPRGGGKTEPDALRFELSDTADDLAEVMRHEGIERAHVLGISMGGMIAQEFALAWPEKVDRLLLAVTTCGRPRGVSPSPRTVATLLRAVTLTPLARSLKQVERLFGDLLFGPAFSREERIRFLRLRRDARPRAPKYTIAQMLAVRRYGTWDRLPTLTMPTLILGAIHDQLMPPINSDILFARIPGARIIKHDAGHCSFFEVADQFAADVLAFIGATDENASAA